MSIRVTIRATSQVAPDEAFRRLAAYDRYPEQTSTVRSVDLYVRDGDSYSTWRVDFRGGVLCWTERDEADPRGRTLTFRQVDGDLELFEGGWRVLPADIGSEIIFSAELDMGIPSLAPIIDPVARQALTGNIRAILEGLFPDAGVDVGDLASVAPPVP